MGVLLFIMVQGKFPHGTKILKDKYYAMIKNKKYDAYFRAVEGTKLSANFKQLVVSLLAFNPSERPSISQLRQCAWLNDKKYNEERTRNNLLSEVKKVLASKKL